MGGPIGDSAREGTGGVVSGEAEGDVPVIAGVEVPVNAGVAPVRAVAAGADIVPCGPGSTPCETAGCAADAAWTGGIVPIARNKRIAARPDAASNPLVASRVMIILPRVMRCQPPNIP